MSINLKSEAASLWSKAKRVRVDLTKPINKVKSVVEVITETVPVTLAPEMSAKEKANLEIKALREKQSRMNSEIDKKISELSKIQ